MVITQSDISKKHTIYKYAHIAGPRRSPDMILCAFHIKFHDSENGIPPSAFRPEKVNKNKRERICGAEGLTKWANKISDLGLQAVSQSENLTQP